MESVTGMKQLGSNLEKELYDKILNAIDGDHLAYEHFLQQTAGLLRGYLMKLMNSRSRSKERAEDLVQDILLAIHLKRHLYKTTEPILPWIYSIARYRFIDSIRAEARRPQYAEWIDNYEDFLSVSETKPEPALDEKIDRMMSILPTKQRKILEMAKMDDVPLAEISQLTGTTLSSVKISVHRALKKLRRNHGKKQDVSL